MNPLNTQETFEIINEMVCYFVKQEKECDFSKYTIYHIINICSNDPVNTGRLGWLLHDSIIKYKDDNALFKFLWQFYDSSKGHSKDKVHWYYKACRLISQKLLDKPLDKGEVMAKQLKLSSVLNKKSIQKECKEFESIIKQMIEINTT